MSVEAELLRTQSVSTMLSPPVLFQRCCAPRLGTLCVLFFTREVARWPSQGSPVGNRRSTRAACKRKQEFQRPYVKARTAQLTHPRDEKIVTRTQNSDCRGHDLHSLRKDCSIALDGYCTPEVWTRWKYHGRVH